MSHCTLRSLPSWLGIAPTQPMPCPLPAALLRRLSESLGTLYPAPASGKCWQMDFSASIQQPSIIQLNKFTWCEDANHTAQKGRERHCHGGATVLFGVPARGMGANLLTYIIYIVMAVDSLYPQACLRDCKSINLSSICLSPLDKNETYFLIPFKTNPEKMNVFISAHQPTFGLPLKTPRVRNMSARSNHMQQ